MAECVERRDRDGAQVDRARQRPFGHVRKELERLLAARTGTVGMADRAGRILPHGFEAREHGLPGHRLLATGEADRAAAARLRDRLHRLGLRLAHQVRAPVARIAADQDEADVSLRRLDQVAEWIVGAVFDDEDVGLEPGLEAAGAVGPLERIGGIRRDHPAQLLVRKGAAKVVSVPQIGDLELAEHVLGARGAPIGAEADPQLGVASLDDLRRVAVEPEVRERRPDDRAGMRGPLLELVRCECRHVNGHEPLLQALRRRDVLELVEQLRRRAFGQVVDERASLTHLLRALAQRVELERQCRLRHLVVAAAKRLVVDVANEEPFVRLRGARRALDRGRPAHDRLHLRVGEHLFRGRRLRPDLRGARDLLRVRPLARPLVVARVRLGARRRPERAEVVEDVAVQVDQARVEHAAGLDHARARELGRRRLAGGGDGRDLAVVGDVDDTVLDRRPVGVEADDLACEREHRPI